MATQLSPYIANQTQSRLNVPQKLRGFVVDKDSGQPLRGVLIKAVAQIDDVLKLPLGMLVSDAAGYVSFDLKILRDLGVSTLKHVWISPVGEDAAKMDVLATYLVKADDACEEPETPTSQQTPVVGPGTDHATRNLPVFSNIPFLIRVDGRLSKHEGSQIRLPSIQHPDLDDWRLSPYSFIIKNDAILGEAGCAVPVPSTIAEREYRLTQVVRMAPPGSTSRPMTEADLGGRPFPSYGSAEASISEKGRALAGDSSELGVFNLNLLDPDYTERLREIATNNMPIMYGKVLEFKQSWIPMGHSLGSIIYSLALAPCESVNIAVIDWSREDDIIRTDKIVSRERLSHSQRRDRTIDESVEAAVHESQGGWSLMGGVAGAESVSASATVPIEGVPINLNLARSIVGSIGGSISNSWGNRDLTGDSLQELHDKVTQTTNVRRSLNSTVIVQATQEEHNYLETRTITNHNHCHALTIQYYEVLRHFKLVTEFVGSQPAILIPYKIYEFTSPIILIHKTILEAALLDRDLLPCFDALVRLRSAKGYDIEADNEQTDDEEDTNAPANELTIGTYYLTLESTLKPDNWDDPRGWIVVELLVRDNWVVLFQKMNKESGGGTLQRPEHQTVLTSGGLLSTEPSHITQVRVKWFENDGGDFWDFKGIRIDYTLTGQTERRTLISTKGLSIPPKSRSNEHALKWFDDSRGQWQEWVGTVPPPESTEEDTTFEKKKDKQKAKQFTREADEYSGERLVTHLNSNIGYYNRAIWLLQDPTERVMMLNAALASHPEILNYMGTTPIAVSGNYVAYALNVPTIDGGQDSNQNPPAMSVVSIPTRGVFAETHLSHCNACEVRDVTRFWKWEESPCEKPPSIEGVTPGPRGQTPNIEPTTLPSPVVQIMQPPAAPDPVGLAAALNLLGQPNIFRDMSGMKELQQLLSGLASGTVDFAKAQLLANQVNEKMATGKGAAGSLQQQTPENRFDNLQVAKEVTKAASDLGWDQKTMSDITSDIVSGNGGSASIQRVSDTESEQDAEVIELEGAKKTLILSGKVADSFTNFGLTARGKFERVPVDNKFWFSKTYEVITYEEIANRNVRRYPSFMLHFIPIFYDLYYQALQARLRKQTVSKLWDDHFKITEAESNTNNLTGYLDQIRECIVSGVKAHILNDMATALEKSYRSYKTKYLGVDLRFEDLEPDYFEQDPQMFANVPPRMFTYLSRLVLPFPSIQVGQYLFGAGNELVKGLPIATIVEWRKVAWEEARKNLSTI